MGNSRTSFILYIHFHSSESLSENFLVISMHKFLQVFLEEREGKETLTTNHINSLIIFFRVIRAIRGFFRYLKFLIRKLSTAFQYPPLSLNCLHKAREP